MKPKKGQRIKGKKVVAIKSSLRTAPILGDGANKVAKGSRRKTLRRSRLVCHAKINRTAYPPREAMLQRIRNRAAESLKQRIQEVEVSEAAKVEAVNQDLVVRHRCTTEDRNLKYKTGTHASTNTARDDFRQAMLAKAANDKDRLIRNSVGSKSTGSTKGGQGAGPSARARGHGMGYDLRRVATTSLPERAAILRLLAS